MNNFLKIIYFIPVSNATAEKSFSFLKFLKVYLRNNMSEQRLNELTTHLYMNKGI